jgi:hypothetical protein
MPATFARIAADLDADAINGLAVVPVPEWALCVEMARLARRLGMTAGRPQRRPDGHSAPGPG